MRVLALFGAVVLLSLVAPSLAACGSPCAADKEKFVGVSQADCSAFTASDTPPKTAIRGLSQCKSTVNDAKEPICCCEAIPDKNGFMVGVEALRRCYLIDWNKKAFGGTGFKLNIKQKNGVEAPKVEKKKEVVVRSYPLIKTAAKDKATVSDIGFEIELKDGDRFLISDKLYGLITQTPELKFKVDLDANSQRLDGKNEKKFALVKNSWKWVPEISFLMDLKRDASYIPNEVKPALEVGMIKLMKKFKTANERKDLTDFEGEKWTELVCDADSEGKTAKMYYVPPIDIDLVRGTKLYWQANIRVSVSQYLSLLNLDYIINDPEAKKVIDAFKISLPKLTGTKEFGALTATHKDITAFLLYVLEACKAEAPGNSGKFKNVFGLFPKLSVKQLLAKFNYDTIAFAACTRAAGIQKDYVVGKDDMYVKFMEDPDIITVSNAFERSTPKLFKDGSFIAEVRDFSQQVKFGWTTSLMKLTQFSFDSDLIQDYLEFKDM